MVPQPEVHRKLTDTSLAVKKLRAIFNKGFIAASSDPKSIYKSDPIFFKNHRLDPFRTRFNTLKKQYCDLKGKFHETGFKIIANLF